MIVAAVLWFLLPLASPETIANMFEWSHDDLAKECARFLGPKGYDGIQISPVHESPILDGHPWWDRYQPFSYKLVSRSGDEAAFKNMVETCNKAKVKVYVDVVFNHMSGNEAPNTVGTGGSRPDCDNKQYPDVPYGPNDFHSSCTIKDWNNNWQVRNCELDGLHDLNQSTEYVRGKITDFLNHLIDIGVAGFRVDAAKHMDPSDLREIYQKTHNLNTAWFPPGSRAYFYQEIMSDEDNDIIKPQDYTKLGGALDFKYGYHLSKAFTGAIQLKTLYNFGEAWGLLPWKDAIVFIDNHDTQRNGIFGTAALNYKQSKLYKMGTGFMLAWPHERAVVMSSFMFENTNHGPPSYPVPINQDLTCSGGWVCEHRWREIVNMVPFAKATEGADVSNWWSNGGSQIAFCRGNKGFVAFNGEQGDLDTYLQTCLEPGDYCDVVSGSKENGSCSGVKVTVQKDGKARIRIPGNSEDGFLAIHSQSKV